MKKPNKFFRKAACFCLVICMVLAMFPAAFADGEAPADLIQADLQAQAEAELLRKKKLREEEEARKAAEAAAAAQAAAEAAAAQQAATEADAAAAQAAAQQEAAVAQQDTNQLQNSETQNNVASENPPTNGNTPVDNPVGENAQTGDNEGAAGNTQSNNTEGTSEGSQNNGISGTGEGGQNNDISGTGEGSQNNDISGTGEGGQSNDISGTGEGGQNNGISGTGEGGQSNGISGTGEGGQSNDISGTGEGGQLGSSNGTGDVGQDDNSISSGDGNQFANSFSLLSSNATNPVLLSSPAATTNIWKAAGQFFGTVKAAIESVFNSGATDATVELTENYEGDEGIDIEVKDGQNVVIDLCKKTFKVISGIAAKITGAGSATIKNGTIESGDGSTVVQTNVDELTVNNTTLVGGSNSADGALDINGGDVDITGKTTIDSGKAANTAIDISGDSDVDVNTTGIVLGKVNANGDEVEAKLHNGYYNGEITAESSAEVEVDGGNYTNNVSKYVSGKTNYAEIRTPNGATYSAGNNIPESAFVSSRFAPTAVNILKSSGAVILPAGVAAINSTGKVIFVNGRPVFCGQTVFIPGCGCRYICSYASIVDGANSVWHKASEDGLTVELSSAVSYVTIDNVKVNAVIDGSYAEFSADTLEALSAGSHTVKFVLKNGSVAATTIKVAPDEKVEWASDSENGLEYEMSGNVKKVLIDHVKVAAEISGKNVSIPASILQDLKTGNHTVEFVLENTSHVVTSITVK